MSFPIFRAKKKKPDRIVVIDLGSRSTKAIYLERTQGRYRLVDFVLIDAPLSDASPSVELYAENLKRVHHALGAKTKHLTLVLGAGDSLIRHAEMPMVPVSDIRSMLKLGTKTYLQQDLSGYVFDCQILPPRKLGAPAETSKGTPRCRVIVGGARQQLIETLQTAAKAAGLMVDGIVPGLIGPPNAFELAQPDIYHREVIALIDLGFKHSTICVLEEGDLMLSRVVAIGGDRLTSGLAESMNIGYAEAEGIKIGMPQEVASNLQSLVAPLGRELRVSIDFYEHQQDKTVSQAFVSGASARSDCIMEMIQSELMIPCKAWSPMTFLEASVRTDKQEELETAGSQLTVAIGVATTLF